MCVCNCDVGGVVVSIAPGTMISLRIASDAREVETVELALLVLHHPNGWLVLDEALELHRDVVCFAGPDKGAAPLFRTGRTKNN